MSPCVCMVGEWRGGPQASVGFLGHGDAHSHLIRSCYIYFLKQLLQLVGVAGPHQYPMRVPTLAHFNTILFQVISPHKTLREQFQYIGKKKLYKLMT